MAGLLTAEDEAHLHEMTEQAIALRLRRVQRQLRLPALQQRLPAIAQLVVAMCVADGAEAVGRRREATGAPLHRRPEMSHAVLQLPARLPVMAGGVGEDRQCDWLGQATSTVLCSYCSCLTARAPACNNYQRRQHLLVKHARYPVVAQRLRQVRELLVLDDLAEDVPQQGRLHGWRTAVVRMRAGGRS